jgi:hypothetical protein
MSREKMPMEDFFRPGSGSLNRTWEKCREKEAALDNFSEIVLSFWIDFFKPQFSQKGELSMITKWKFLWLTL